MSRSRELTPLEINTRPHPPKAINFQPDEGSALMYHMAFPSSAADTGQTQKEGGPARARLLLVGMLINLE